MIDRLDARVVVAGGGIAGLAAAVSAAAAGRNVTLFEPSSRPGGRAVSHDQDGFRSNLGPHALYPAAERLLERLGVTVTGGHPRTDHATRGGRVYRLPIGVGSLLATRLLGPRAKVEAARIFQSIGSTDPSPLDSVSVDRWLGGSVTTAGARQYLHAVIRLSTYVDAPGQQSAGAVVRQFHAGGGVRYLDGGWQTIVEGLGQVAQKAGAVVVTRQRVVAVETGQDSAVTGVRLADGSHVAADAAILAVPPSDASRLAPPAVAGELRKWAAASIPARAACLDVALSRLPGRAKPFILGIDRPLYLSTHSKWAAGLAPEGSALVSVAKYLSPGEAHDAAADEVELEGLLSLAQPGWRRFVMWRRFLPALTVSNALVTAEGGGMPGRPGPAVSACEGLFVAGDWVGPQGMLAEASLASGIAAGELAAMVKTRPAAGVA